SAPRHRAESHAALQRMLHAGRHWMGLPCLGRGIAAWGMLGLAGFLFAGSVRAEAVLTVAMTAGNVPVTTGNPDQGFEGYRFVGYNLYDALALWDLSRSDKASDIRPGLATSWEIDKDNPRRWIVHLREGVKYHDGCDFSADDVVWNVAF